MHCRFFFTVFLVLGVIGGVLSTPTPLEITHAPVKLVGGVPDKEETENLARLKTAKTDANRQILKMEHVLDNPTVPQNAEMIHAAFGKNAKVDKIKKTVVTLKTGTVPVTLHTDTDPSCVASVSYDGSISEAQAIPGNIDFGKDFHDTQRSCNMRAATLVHESTHRLANTGDLIDPNGKMIPGNDFVTKSSGRYGYGSSAIVEPAKTAQALNNDKKWTNMRDGTDQYPAVVDLHNNAESYAQFASMCDAAISDAAVGLRRRALKERDWETAAVYLLRRAACAMRKNGSVKQTAASRNSGHSSATNKKSRLPVAVASSAKKTLPKNNVPKALSRGRLVKSRIPLAVDRGSSKVQKKSSPEIHRVASSQSSRMKSRRKKVSSLPGPVGLKAKPRGLVKTSKVQLSN